MTKGKVYLWLQAAVCIALVVSLSVGAVGIYRKGTARRAENPMESIYTPEEAAEKFSQTAPLFFVGLGLMIAGFVLRIKDEEAQKPVKDADLNRDLLTARIASPSGAMISEQRKQKRLQKIGWGLFALCMVPVLVYLLNPVHFPPDDPEGMFLGLMRILLPWTFVGLGALGVSSALQEKSILREIQAAQEQLKEEKADGAAPVPVPAVSPKNKGALQTVVIIAAIALIIAGVLNKSAYDVLCKAVTICTECVGLG